MRKRISYLLLAGLLCGGAPAVAQEGVLAPLETTEIEEVKSGVGLQDIEAYLNNIKTMTADFTQLAQGTQTSGKLSMERPGRVRFEYGDDIPVLVVSDGNNVSFIDYDVGQVTRWPVNDTPLGFLLKSDLSLEDDVVILGGGPDPFAGYTYLTAKDPDKPEQGEMTLIFTGRLDGEGPEAFQLFGWEVIDAQGNITNIRLANREINVPLGDELWEFEDPRAERLQRRRRR